MHSSPSHLVSFTKVLITTLTVVAAFTLVTREVAAQVTLVSTTPDANAVSVAADSDITLTFDADVDASTVRANVVLFSETNGVLGYTHSTAGPAAIISPDVSFDAGELIYVSILTGLRSTGGDPLINPHTFGFVAVARGNGQFDGGQVINDGRSNDALAFADFDGDGDLDVWTTSTTASVVYLNDGSGIYSNSGQALPGFTSFGVATGDVDGDGDVDVFLSVIQDPAPFVPNRLFINDGAGNFSTVRTYGNALSYNVDLGDVDGDGDLDAWVVNNQQNNAVWFNDGTGDFTTSVTLPNSNGRGEDVVLGDLDGDGDLDAVEGIGNGPSQVWLNDGMGGFTNSGQNIGGGALQIGLGDLDGDGDLDFVTLGSGENQVYLNDGNATFTLGSGFAPGSPSRGGELGDMDGDGDLDVFFVNSPALNELWLNDGAGNFTFGDSVGDPFANTSTVLGDVDGDGDLDAYIAVGGATPDRVVYNAQAVFELASHDPAAYTVGVPSDATITLNFAGDVDDDTVVDNVLVYSAWRGLLPYSHVTAGSAVTLAPDEIFEQGERIEVYVTTGLQDTGGGALLAPHAFDFVAEVLGGFGRFQGSTSLSDVVTCENVAIADFDGDGDLDLWQAGNRVWFNDGTGTLIDSGQVLTPRSFMWDVATGDIDGDGDIDVFASNQFPNANANQVWFNDGAGNFGGLVSYPNTLSLGAAMGDLDGDGDLDVFVVNNQFDNQILFNDGTGTFTNTTLPNSSGRGSDVELGDLDDDGDLDAFETLDNAGNRVWFNDGAGNFTNSGQDLTTGSSFTHQVELGDMDGDGDLDALDIADGGNKLWLNDGAGFFTDSGVRAGGNSSSGGDLGDMDGDGDLDVMIANLNARNELYLNDGAGNLTLSVTTGPSFSSTDTKLGDMDNDGDLDAFITVAGQNDRVLFNDFRPILSFTSATFTMDEDSALTTDLVITRSGRTNIATSVDVTFTDGTATGGLDYDATTRTVNFADGETTARLAVPITDDDFADPNETFTAVLTDTGGGNILSGNTSALVTITDNDSAGAVITPTDVEVTEGGVTGSYTIRLTSEPIDPGGVVVDIEPDAGEIELSLDDVNFEEQIAISFDGSNWDIPQTVYVRAVDDASIEGLHSDLIEHTSPTSGSPDYSQRSLGDVNVQITDNDFCGNGFCDGTDTIASCPIDCAVTDAFAPGDAQGWSSADIEPAALADNGPAGTADAALHALADAPGIQPLVIFNSDQRWLDNWTSRGQDMIYAHVRNCGPTPLVLRIGVAQDEDDADSSVVSTVGIPLANDCNYRVLTFPAAEADFTQVGDETVAETLVQVAEFRIFHAAAPNWDGDDVTGEIDIDNISNVPLAPLCGDGAQDAGEACDDGNQRTDDGCAAGCALEFCGDGVQQASEACEDGNTEPNDGCGPTCDLEFCGDGVQQISEECDDGTANNSDTAPDACRTNCDLPTCGDGVIDMNEGCDDGDANDDTAPDACRTTCALPTCGDGALDDGEECDDDNNDPDDGCSPTCFDERCGDGVQQASEACDDGDDANSDTDPDACRTDCALPTCGDGVMDDGEACDDGDANDDADPDACRTTCEAASCGDGVIDTGEDCEGTDLGGESCSSQGYDSGTLACGSCGLDISACVLCGDDVCEGNETIDGCPADCLELDTFQSDAGGWAGTPAPSLGSDVGPEVTGDDALTFSATGGVLLTSQGEARWLGDWTAREQTTIYTHAINCGATDLSLRVGVDGAGGTFVSSDPQTLPNDCNYHTLSFPVEAGDLSAVDGTDAPATLADVTALVLLHSEGLSFDGEVLDDGVDARLDNISNAPLAPICGDGETNGSDGCDDGNRVDGDGCDATCALEFCGDGVQQTGEECDDGGNAPNDGCDASCVVEFCGDGVQQTGEACDDGDANSDADPDACRTTCEVPTCGDGVTDMGETCDDGDGNDDVDPDACRTNCALPTCGDGVLDDGEACDDGTANHDTAPDACRTTCVLAYCGDDALDDGETCDDGDANDDDDPDACRTDCALPTCGDGVIDMGEECDDADANSDDPDACRTDCALPTCGDGVIDTGEECDGGPGCELDCTMVVVEFCGDGTTNASEECDDGDANSDTDPDACRTNCALPICGDGVIDTGEECDDVDEGCAADCTLVMVNEDLDNDGVADDIDNCVEVENPEQEDADADGIGDACDDTIFPSEVDFDRDNIIDEEDNCPEEPNPDQADEDGNGMGDLCEIISVGQGTVDECECSSIDASPNLPHPMAWIVLAGVMTGIVWRRR